LKIEKIITARIGTNIANSQYMSVWVDKIYHTSQIGSKISQSNQMKILKPVYYIDKSFHIEYRIGWKLYFVSQGS